MLKAGHLAGREDHRVRGIKSGITRADRGISHVCIDKLEMVQRRAAHFVKGDYSRTSSVTAKFADLQWYTLSKGGCRPCSARQ